MKRAIRWAGVIFFAATVTVAFFPPRPAASAEQDAAKQGANAGYLEMSRLKNCRARSE